MAGRGGLNLCRSPCNKLCYGFLRRATITSLPLSFPSTSTSHSSKLKNTMAASSRRVLSLSSRMKAPQLLFASIALSSSWNAISLVDSFAIRSHPCSSTSAFLLPRRQVHLPPRDRRPSALSSSDDGEVSEDDSSGHSVTGPIYDVDAGPSVKLFTKEGGTLCDKVKDVSCSRFLC